MVKCGGLGACTCASVYRSEDVVDVHWSECEVLGLGNIAEETRRSWWSACWHVDPSKIAIYVFLRVMENRCEWKIDIEVLGHRSIWEV